MTKEEIKAFKPIINSMKLIRDVCDNQESCYSCIFTDDGEHCLLRVPIGWKCEAAIAALEEQEDIAESDHQFERYYVEQLKRPERIWVYVQGSIGTWEHAADVCRKYSDAGLMARVVRVSVLDREVGDTNET